MHWHLCTWHIFAPKFKSKLVRNNNIQKKHLFSITIHKNTTQYRDWQVKIPQRSNSYETAYRYEQNTTKSKCMIKWSWRISTYSVQHEKRIRGRLVFNSWRKSQKSVLCVILRCWKPESLKNCIERNVTKYLTRSLIYCLPYCCSLKQASCTWGWIEYTALDRCDRQ